MKKYMHDCWRPYTIAPAHCLKSIIALFRAEAPVMGQCHLGTSGSFTSARLLLCLTSLTGGRADGVLPGFSKC